MISFYDVLNGLMRRKNCDLYVTGSNSKMLASDREKSEYLKNLFDEVYLKDILQRNRLRNEEWLSQLLSVIASSIGSFTNPSRIENTFIFF